MNSKLLFIFWFMVLSVPFSIMMGTHTLSLQPSRNPRLKDLSSKEKEKLTVLHFVNPECGCSEKVVKSLSERSSDKQSREVVHILGTHTGWVKALEAKGYEVKSGKMDDYEKIYTITAIPQLVIIDQNKEILYSGGYSSKRGPASTVEDKKILSEVKASKNSIERPIYGCVNGSENQRKTDPFGSKKRNL